jgi:hypothetical protein
VTYIRFRLGNIDSYQGTPTSLDRNDFPKVPIIRIWGAADETGQKVCQRCNSSGLKSRFVAMSMVCFHIAM